MGSFVTIYAASILMIAAMSSLGLIISNYSNNFQQAIYLYFIFIVTSLLMSGFWTPATSMPPWAQAISSVMPPKYYMVIMRGAYLKGSGFIHLWKEFLALGFFAIGFGAAAIATYRKRT